MDVDLHDSVRLGGRVTANTVRWWDEQGGFRPVGQPHPVELALNYLGCWLEPYDVERVWCKGPHFDIATLDSHAAWSGVPLPWKFYQARDTRTLCSVTELLGATLPYASATHRADEDCTVQIADVVEAYRYLRDGRT